MKHEKAHIDYELIAKHLAGETDFEEDQQLQLWRDAAEENKKEFARMHKLWQHSGRSTPHEVDVDAAWTKFTQNTGKESTPVPDTKGKTSPMYYLLRVAAMVIIGAIIYMIYKGINTTTPVNDIQLTASSQMVTDSLPDGSFISLNSRSQLTYPEEFSSNEREVQLQGEAFFNVSPNKKQPFIIKAREITVIVVGTSFYVKAYDSISSVMVGVKEGIVKVKANKEGFTLHAGQHIAFNRSTGNFQPVDTFDTNKIFWKTRNLTFKDESLHDVFKAIEDAYHVSVKVQNPQILDCKLTAKFQNDSVDHIIDIINTNFNLTSEKNKNSFFISGEGCQ